MSTTEQKSGLIKDQALPITELRIKTIDVDDDKKFIKEDGTYDFEKFIKEDGTYDFKTFLSNLYKQPSNFLVDIDSMRYYKIFPCWENPSEILIPLVVFGFDYVKLDSFTTLSKKKRLKIKRTFDAFHTIECETFPKEEVVSATLYIELNTGEKIEYFPIKKLENIKGSFSFFDNPIHTMHDFKYSIGFEFNCLQYERKIKIRMEVYMFSVPERKKILPYL